MTDERLPTIDCPKSGIKYVDNENIDKTEKVTPGTATAKGDKHVLTKDNIVSPSTYTLSKDTLYKVITVKQEATDDEGFKAVCLFQYIIKREYYVYVHVKVHVLYQHSWLLRLYETEIESE